MQTKSKKWITVGAIVLFVVGIGYWILKDSEMSCTSIPSQALRDGGHAYICGVYFPGEKKPAEDQQ